MNYLTLLNGLSYICTKSVVVTIVVSQRVGSKELARRDFSSPFHCIVIHLQICLLSIQSRRFDEGSDCESLNDTCFELLLNYAMRYLLVWLSLGLVPYNNETIDSAALSIDICIFFYKQFDIIFGEDDVYKNIVRIFSSQIYKK